MKCHVKLPVNPAKQSLPRIIKSMARSAVLRRKDWFNCYQVTFLNVGSFHFTGFLSLMANQDFVARSWQCLVVTRKGTKLTGEGGRTGMAKLQSNYSAEELRCAQVRTCSGARASEQVLGWTSSEVIWNVKYLQFQQQISHWNPKFRKPQPSLLCTSLLRQKIGITLPCLCEMLLNSLGEGVQPAGQVLGSDAG